MKITWKDIKEEVRKLGFSEIQEFNDEYLPNIYEVANSAIIDLAQSVSPIKKQYRITNMAPKNLISDAKSPFLIHTHKHTDIIFEAINAKAYYFECDGNCVLTIEDENRTVLQTINIISSKQFEPYRGFIKNSTRTTILRFSGEYAYNIKNIAMYDRIYSSFTDEIAAFGKYIAYNIKDLTKTAEGQAFMCFDEHHPILNADSIFPRVSEDDYSFEGDGTILLNRERQGEYIVSYNAYPKKITSQTSDTEIISIEPNAARLIPLYIASRIYKDDEPEKAIMYYNEYSQLKSQIFNQTPIYEIWTFSNRW